MHVRASRPGRVVRVPTLCWLHLEVGLSPTLPPSMLSTFLRLNLGRFGFFLAQRGVTRATTAYKYGNTWGEGSSDAGAANDDSRDESSHPQCLLGGWLEDAFVGFLREDALLFVWDHLFLLG